MNVTRFRKISGRRCDSWKIGRCPWRWTQDIKNTLGRKTLETRELMKENKSFWQHVMTAKFSKECAIWWWCSHTCLLYQTWSMTWERHLTRTELPIYNLLWNFGLPVCLHLGFGILISGSRQLIGQISRLSFHSHNETERTAVRSTADTWSQFSQTCLGQSGSQMSTGIFQKSLHNLAPKGNNKT